MPTPPKIIIPPAFAAHRRPVPTAHPRLLGSRDYLQSLAHERPDSYKHMLDSARSNQRFDRGRDLDAKVIAFGIANTLESDHDSGRAAVDLVLKRFVNRPIRKGHVTFASDLACTALAYDLCHDLWTPDERTRAIQYVHATIDANTGSEPSVFHNGWYGYKHWGYGMAAYALYHDDPDAPKILADLEHDYLHLAAPALQMAGKGGGWAEGFYGHYWLDMWLYFCETARLVEGLDYYAAAPDFFNHRAVASMFEQFPTLMQNNSRRPIPMGDSHGRTLAHVRDQALTARRILVNYFRNDPAHQAVHAYNLQSQIANPYNYHMDFLWNDPTVTAADLDAFKLSHLSPGPGFVYARSSWKEDATHFFFKSGRRFTSHQHLDNGQFLIFKNQELLGDGGHYGSFDSNHAVNYCSRTIAHNSILIRDPDESWPQRTPATPKGMRDGPNCKNDGGQAFPWSGTSATHNGYALDVPHWYSIEKLMDIASLPAFKDHGHYVYAAGDFTKSYSAKKAKSVTRQIVFLRPDTFIIFDRVIATNPNFKKSFLLQTAKIPTQTPSKTHWLVTNPGPSEFIPEGAPHGNAVVAPDGAQHGTAVTAKLFIQILEPVQHTVELFHGDTLYRYTPTGESFPPDFLDPPAPECRMEISPTLPAKSDYFLHILTVADAATQEVPLASHHFEKNDLIITIGPLTTRITLAPTP